MEAIPASVSYRPERITPKPRTTGPQTAVVVGPPGEEIWTDQYGRIKVQFFWDRLGRFDHNSSCWLRVSAPWAGSNFGGTPGLSTHSNDSSAIANPAATVTHSYCCLLGPSGCGKSTTLRMIAGHESVSSGDILMGSRNITDLPAAARGTAMMFQSFALFPHLTALDNVAFSLKMKGVARAERQQQA